MKCPNCNSEIMEGFKFCTVCGTQAVSVPSQGTEVTANESIAATKEQSIYWNISKGEVACRINEAEFTAYDAAKGLIVNDGTTAYIKENGKIAAEIQGGYYDFGRKDDNKIAAFISLIKSMRSNKALSIQLKLDKEFALVFDCKAVRTRILDINVGIRIIFRIGDFERFSAHYLADETVVTDKMLVEALYPNIRVLIQNVLIDKDIQSQVLAADVSEAISAAIYDAEPQFYGLEIVRIAEIASSNEDMERLRNLGQEMYLSEQELEYLKRTNDFKNRLATETNAQAIQDARNELNLHQGLQDVEKKKILSDFEMERLNADLEDERKRRELERRKMERLAEMDLDNMEMDAQMERLRRLKELNREDRKFDFEQERERERWQQESLERHAQLSPEQIMAINAGRHMETQAAAAFAASFTPPKPVQPAAPAVVPGVCPGCGASVPPGAKFCSSCGTVLK